MKSKFGIWIIGWIMLMIFIEIVILRIQAGSWEREKKPSEKGYGQREYEENDATVSTISGRRMVLYI